jgi:hypothetical protein
MKIEERFKLKVFSKTVRLSVEIQDCWQKRRKVRDSPLSYSTNHFG